MARPNRIKLDGEGYYHVIDRIAHREFLLRDERIKKRLIDLVRRAAEFSGVDVCTYVIMDNHLHLCARDPGPLRNRHGNRHEGPVPINLFCWPTPIDMTGDGRLDIVLQSWCVTPYAGMFVAGELGR